MRDYLANMKTMIMRSEDPWSEKKKIDWIHWGAKEELRCIVPREIVTTVSELDDELREAERCTLPTSADSYRLPYLVNKEFGYDPSRYAEKPEGTCREKSDEYKFVNAVTDGREEARDRRTISYRSHPFPRTESRSADRGRD